MYFLNVQLPLPFLIHLHLAEIETSPFRLHPRETSSLSGAVKKETGVRDPGQKLSHPLTTGKSVTERCKKCVMCP